MRRSTANLSPRQRGYAAEPSEKRKRPQRVLFFNAIKAAGQTGMTYDELKKMFDIKSEIGTRMIDLCRLKVIRPFGERNTEQGSPATVYVAVPGATEDDAWKKPPGAQTTPRSVLKGALVEIRDEAAKYLKKKSRHMSTEMAQYIVDACGTAFTEAKIAGQRKKV